MIIITYQKMFAAEIKSMPNLANQVIQKGYFLNLTNTVGTRKSGLKFKLLFTPGVEILIELLFN